MGSISPRACNERIYEFKTCARVWVKKNMDRRMHPFPHEDQENHYKNNDKKCSTFMRFAQIENKTN
jgi:hypothetical protein